MNIVTIVSFAAMTSIAACGATEPNEREARPNLGDSGIPITFTAPDTVTRGVSFEASFTHYGSSSCIKGIRIQTQVDGSVATLDSHVRILEGICTDDLHSFIAVEHLQFNTAGIAQIELPGRFDGRDTIVTRTVIVR
jgi:hypothetical protein